MLKGKISQKHSLKFKNVLSTQKPLELIHMDLFGLSTTKSIDGNYYAWYWLIDSSRYTWTIFLASKKENFKVLSKFYKS